jgi:hypothetical protein
VIHRATVHGSSGIGQRRFRDEFGAPGSSVSLKG